MDKELDDKLVRDFPNLYRDRYASAQETCMCWGFPQNGWFDLIYELSKKLELMILLLPEAARPHMKASQVKEKFGVLRFYMTLDHPEFAAVIWEAENKSSHICETCGQTGKLIQADWLYTACPEHTKEEYRNSSTTEENDEDG